MAYVEYPIERVAIHSLHLDVSNYRFASDQTSETAALNYLWAEERVTDVAELILRDGYIDIEQPIVVSEQNRFIVLEGNRRVSALMALHDPSLAPAHEAAIRRLLRRFALEAEALPNSIRVMVFPNRAAAAPILARVHIGTSKKRWDLDEQAKFVMAQLSDGVTLEQLSSNLPGIESVPRVMRMGRIREALRSTSFSDASIEEYARGPRLKMSSFEYAYRQSAIQEIIGLKFDAEARVDSWPSSPEELSALERLLRGFRDGELNTRRGLKPKTIEFEKLLNEMKGVSEEIVADASQAPSGESSDTGTPGDSAPQPDVARTEPDEPVQEKRDFGAPSGNNDDGSPTSSESQSTETQEMPRATAPENVDDLNQRGPNDPLRKQLIQLAGIDEIAQPVTMQRRLRELRRVNVNELPAGAAMLMRSVLEAAIKEHYGRSNGIDAVGELGSVFKQVKSDYSKNGQLSNAIGVVSRFGHDATHIPGSGRWFNMIAHSVNVDVDGEQVQRAWLAILPLVRFLLSEPQRKV